MPEVPANTPSAAAAASSHRALSRAAAPVAASLSEAWAPANPIEDHLARKIAALGIAIENHLNAIAALDPANDQHARRLSTISLTAARLQKVQLALESRLNEMQSQRGLRATHPLTCEPIPLHADARPYVQAAVSIGSAPVFRSGERLVASSKLPKSARRRLEDHFGARIWPARNGGGNAVSLSPESLRKPTPTAAQTPRKLRESAPG